MLGVFMLLGSVLIGCASTIEFRPLEPHNMIYTNPGEKYEAPTKGAWMSCYYYQEVMRATLKDYSGQEDYCE